MEWVSPEMDLQGDYIFVASLVWVENGLIYRLWRYDKLRNLP
jgi:hypothetical protein